MSAAKLEQFASYQQISQPNRNSFPRAAVHRATIMIVLRYHTKHALFSPKSSLRKCVCVCAIESLSRVIMDTHGACASRTSDRSSIQHLIRAVQSPYPIQSPPLTSIHLHNAHGEREREREADDSESIG